MTLPSPSSSDGLDPEFESLLDERLANARPSDTQLLARVKARVMGAIGSGVINAWDPAGAWLPLAPKVEQKVLWRDGALGAFLLRCRPGAVLPAHVHGCDEEILVLQGTLRIGDDVVLTAGDYQRLPAGSRHPVSTAPEGALVFARGTLVF